MTKPREDGWDELRREIEALRPDDFPAPTTNEEVADWDSFSVGVGNGMSQMQRRVLAIVDRLAAARGEPEPVAEWQRMDAEWKRLRRIEVAARDLTENEPRGTLNRYRWNALRRLIHVGLAR